MFSGDGCSEMYIMLFFLMLDSYSTSQITSKNALYKLFNFLYLLFLGRADSSFVFIRVSLAQLLFLKYETFLQTHFATSFRRDHTQ